MAVTRPCYCSRDDAQRSIDFKDSVISNAQLDRAIQSAARNIDKQMHRRFYPEDLTKWFDWPNYQYAYPWRLWFDQHDLIVATALQSPAGTTIPLWQVFAEPVNSGPPFTHIELDRSTIAAWGAGPTPQHSIQVTGTWGYTAEADPAGTLTAAALAGDTTVTVSDGSQAGAGDVLILGYGQGTAPYPAFPGTAGALAPYLGERVLVTDKNPAATGQTQAGSGCTTASAADNALQVASGAALNTGEVLLLDQERMLIEQINGNTATVKRAWDGTVLAAHSGAAVYAFRLLSVLRGQLGTTAAGWSSGTAVSKHRPPALIRDLNIAEAANRVLQESSGYARTVGHEAPMPAPGVGLADLWDEAVTAHGRKNRTRVI